MANCCTIFVIRRPSTVIPLRQGFVHFTATTAEKHANLHAFGWLAPCPQQSLKKYIFFLVPGVIG